MLRRPFDFLADNALLVIVLSTAAVVLLVGSAHLVVPDTWMNLTSGREIVQHGLPQNDPITVLGRGRAWVDQQWGAQVLTYGAERLGGLRLVTILTALAIVSAFGIVAAAARASGASVLSTALLCEAAVVAAPWAWQARAQTIALPLFAGTLWLLLDGQRAARPRTLLVLPLLVVWANVHGTVMLGAVLVAAAGLIDLVRRRGNPLRATALLVGAPLCLFASPYALELPGYYRRIVVSPPFAGLIDEWRRTGLEPRTAVFWILTAVMLALAASQRRRLSAFEVVALTTTLAAAVTAIRGIPWFALTMAAIVPRLLDDVTGWENRSGRPGINRCVVLASVAIVGAALAFTATRPSSWFERRVPTSALPAIASATADRSTTVLASTEFANWLLWRDPSLRGRLAYDVRFEIYPRSTLVAVKAFEESPAASELAGAYGVIVSEGAGELGLPVVFTSPGATVAVRPVSP